MNNDRRKALAKLADAIDAARASLEEIRDEIDNLKSEEDDGFNNLPEGLQQAERGQAMEAAAEQMQTAYDLLDGVSGELQDAIDAINAAMEG
jgi:prefoldin subunit 5